MITATERLRAQSGQYPRKVIEVAENIHVAVGFAASNVGLIVAPDGPIIIDTTESTAAAGQVADEFSKLTDLPAAAIIYTHGHRDHISGASCFADKNTQIIASARLRCDLDESSNTGPLQEMHRRARRQFGMDLQPYTERINIGIGPAERPLAGLGSGFVKPTVHIADERKTLTVAGVELELIHAPGETADHMVVWHPATQTLFCADNYYHAFPGLYAIRGTKYRDFRLWSSSLQILQQLQAAHMIPGHTLPVSGRQEITSILASYQQAIEYVVEKCNEAIDAGCTPDDLAAKIALPDHLANKPYLQEFYCSLQWAARAYYAGELGWFDGNPTNLYRLAPRVRAEKLAAALGSKDKVLEQAHSALSKQDWQWALELTDIALHFSELEQKAAKLRIDALRAAADEQISASARNYYLSCAKELDEKFASADSED